MKKHDVSFDSAGISLAAHLYVPEGAAGSRAIVVGHPGSGVKEQAAGLYARLLAERGFVTLAFDAAYQGESGGVPRGLEDPAHRVEDFKAAVTYLGTRPEADPDRIGALGICASGGYVLNAAASDHRIRAVATVSAADIARQFRFGADGDQDPAVFQGMLDAAAAARSGAGPQTFELFPEALRTAGGHAGEGYDYYMTPRAQHPRSIKQMSWESVDRMAIFDSYAAIPLLTRPLLMIVGRRAVTSWMTVEALGKATGPKRMSWIEGASHVDLYDKSEYVGPAVEQLTDFYAVLGRNGIGLSAGTTDQALAASGSSN
ncbi:alpha/beta hydrolase [Actinoplanes sp. TBRC 11911]|uniref:alpha/beta hydrolase n=1 Tax=Actinoplanes sp. TBRC 11911 TaxID=2729386 RepID=UPI00145CA974|nr:alpha/beta hydrolase [Actinoplanes sp. TBRC 11911]NMO49762.1 alpha/beta hydrolase [Actinoplanes sp. TBRC 11911]